MLVGLEVVDGLEEKGGQEHTGRHYSHYVISVEVALELILQFVLKVADALLIVEDHLADHFYEGEEGHAGALLLLFALVAGHDQQLQLLQPVGEEGGNQINSLW